MDRIIQWQIIVQIDNQISGSRRKLDSSLTNTERGIQRLQPSRTSIDNKGLSLILI